MSNPENGGFSTLIKVRYAEIDGQKIVFNSRYLEYADVAVTEYWEWTGIEAALGTRWSQTEFHVRRTEIDYLKPFVLGDTIAASVRLARLGTTSITKAFELRHSGTGELHTAISMVSVHVDLETHRPTPFPADVRGYLERLTG